jgi:general secretion pathway protein H
MTLIEIMITIAIVAIAISGVVLSYRAVERANVRSRASKLASAIRYLYDRSVVTGKYYRLAIDLDRASYEAQVSDDRFYLNADKEQSPGRGQAFDADARIKALDAEDQKRRQNGPQGLSAQLQPPPMAKRAHFQSFKDAMLPRIDMRGAYVRDVYTPRQREPYTRGKAFLYFFPDGHTERAVLHVQAGRPPQGDQPLQITPPDVAVYTLFLKPLSGRVSLVTGDINVPRDFDSTDDQGEIEAGR